MALGELSLLVVLAVALLIIDPVATLLAAVCFSLVSVVVHRALSGWASQIGTEVSDRSISSRSRVRQATESFRELRTSRRLGFPVQDFADDALIVGQGQADLLFINNVPKIAYESALVLGAAVLVGWRVVSGDLSTALAFLAVFLTAAARLLPSMVRLQGQVVMIKGAAGQAWVTFDLADVDAHPERASDDVVLAADLPGPPSAFVDFDPSVEVSHLTVRHPGMPAPTLVDVCLHVAGGESLVLVGVTGAGKSTLVDVMLGVAPPESGRVLLGGLPPDEAQAHWPGAISYMPQDSALWHGSVRENVGLGLPRDAIDDDAVWHALEQAHLAADVVEKGGLDFQVGSSGQRLSGGQRQRLGIARALYSQPRLLFLDEATSALDEDTEALIGRVLDELRGRVTVVAVAHRLATIERASQLAVIVDGTVGYQGSPQEYLEQRRALRATGLGPGSEHSRACSGAGGGACASRPARPPRPLLLPCCLASFVVMGAAWSLASPPLSSADEDYHLASIRASTGPTASARSSALSRCACRRASSVPRATSWTRRAGPTASAPSGPRCSRPRASISPARTCCPTTSRR